MAQYIRGYRDLTAFETSLINEGKELGERLNEYINKLRSHGDAFDQRWISMGRTDMQRGLMCLTRGIAQPTNF